MRIESTIFFALLIFCFSCENQIQDSEPKENLTGDSLEIKFRALNDKIVENPTNAALYFERAKLQFSTKEILSALVDVDRAIRLDSTNCDYYLFKADLHFSMRFSGEAKDALLRCLANDPNNTEAYLKLAEIFMIVEQYEQCMYNVNKALSIDVHNAKAYYIKGMTYELAGDTARAVSSFLTAVEQDSHYYEAYMQLGYLYAVSDNKIALDFYDNAIRIKPESIDAIYNKSMFLQEHGNPDKAIMGYELILKIQPDNREAVYNLGYVYLVLKNEYEKAIPFFSQAIEHDSTYYQAIYNRGLSFEKLTNYTEAERDYRKALQVKPDFVLAAEGLSRILE